jgi:hypothetical protein
VLREGEQQGSGFLLLVSDFRGDLDRAGNAISATTGTIGGVRGDVRTVALGIAPDLIHQGVVDLIGYQVISAEDLAKLALAMIDEGEKPTHIRQRLTVVY